MDLIMPEKYKEITVRIVSAPYVSGNDAYCDVQMWGNPQKWTYRMKLGKTLWFSIYNYLQQMDNSRFSEELEPSVLQDNLEFLNGRIVTVRATSDERMTFTTKNGGVEYGKKFIVDFRGDLEEADRVGGDVLKKAFFDTVLDNTSGIDCITINSKLAKLTIQLEKEKIDEKELKKKQKEMLEEANAKEKKKKDWEKSTEEWVVKKREDDKKKDKQLKQLDLAGW